MFNVANINCCTETEGPYKRVAIWFQGCKKRCCGCCNIELQELKLKHLMSLDELLNIILKAKEEFKIEGVTFLGGEPTLQIELPSLCEKLKNNNIGVILFTGLNINQIDYRYLKYCDIIVDGEFDITKLDKNRNMIGSTNQNINLMTERYKNDLEWFTSKREKQIEINYNQELYFNGDVFKSK